jgi:flagellar basal body-associated protein FliL
MPAVRNRILLLLSAKEPRELMTLEGEPLLAADVAPRSRR